jgi:hypothetical protein
MERRASEREGVVRRNEPRLRMGAISEHWPYERDSRRSAKGGPTIEEHQAGRSKIR